MIAPVFILALAIGADGAKGADAAAAAPTYQKDIKPLLERTCVGCHSAKNRAEIDVSGGLSLDAYPEIMKSGVVRPGDARRSEIVVRLREKDPDSRMPRDAKPLGEDAIELVERWIQDGATVGEPEAQAGKAGAQTAKPGSEAAKTGAQAGEARPQLTPVPQPKFRPARPRDLALPLTLVLPPDCPHVPSDFPRDKLELRVKVAPLAPISAVAFGPGALFAAGGHGTVTLWDLEKGEALRVSTAVRGTVHAVRFSPDGRRLAIGGGPPGKNGELAVLDVGSWSVIQRLQGHREAVLDVAFSPSGDLLASAGFDKTAILWDLKSGAARLTITEHSDAVYGVAFLSGGKALASAGADRAIKITDLEQGKTVRSLGGHDKPILALAASPDGATLVSSGVEPALRFWSAAEGKLVKTAGGHGGRVQEAAFSRDGKLLASVGSDRTLRIWNASSQKQEKSLAGAAEWLYSVDFDASARRVAAGAWDGTVRIWDVAGGRVLAVLLQPAARDDADLDWALSAPEGWFRASPGLLPAMRVAGSGRSAELPAAALSRILTDPERIAASLRGEPAAPPRLKPERAF